MYISENDLKARILAGQIEILDDVLNGLRTRYESSVICEHPISAMHLQEMITEYSKFRTTLAREKRTLETGK